VEAAVEVWRAAHPEADVRVESRGSAVVAMTKSDVEAAVCVLLDNALAATEAAAAAGPIVVRSGSERGSVFLTVEDEGVGVDPANVGTHRRALLHHEGDGDRAWGWACSWCETCSSSSGGASRSSGDLLGGRPCDSASPRRSWRVVERESDGEQPTLLIVDDDAAFRAALGAALARRGFAIELAADAAEAEAIARARVMEYALVDVRMAGRGRHRAGRAPEGDRRGARASW
jgi:hypothetical protein